MEKQSEVIKALHSALDELELLFIEGEELDLKIVEDILAKVQKLQKAIMDKK